MQTQLKRVFYIYFGYIYTLLLTYSYTVYVHIRNSIHAPPPQLMLVAIKVIVGISSRLLPNLIAMILDIN